MENSGFINENTNALETINYKDLFMEAFNTICEAYKSEENRAEILANYMAKNACCCKKDT